MGERADHVETNYERLFGTPEKAAATLEFFELDTLNWCADDGTREACKLCPYDFDRYGCCHDDDDFTMLEWLKRPSHAPSGSQPGETADFPIADPKTM